jgi:hypothetical protein
MVMRSKLIVVIAEIWLPAIGAGIFIAWAIGAWYGGNKALSIWLAFGGAVCLLLLGALQWRQAIRDAPRDAPAKSDKPDRPWISVDVSLVGPLAYDDKGWDAGKRWHIPVQYELKNTGSNPAVGVDMTAAILPFMLSIWPPDSLKDGVRQGRLIPGTDAAAELRSMCDRFADFRSSFPSDGRTLFGDKTMRGTFTLNGDPARFDAAKNNTAFSGNFLILVCATYRFVTEEKMHQTAEAFALFRPNGKINIEGETIPLIELGFVAQPMGGSFAN